MLTEKDYCDYDTAWELCSLGYPEEDWILLYSAQKWLREEKNVDVLIQLETKDIHLSSKHYSIYISYMGRFRREFSYMSKNFDSYEDALVEGVREAIKLLKEK